MTRSKKRAEALVRCENGSTAKRSAIRIMHRNANGWRISSAEARLRAYAAIVCIALVIDDVAAQVSWFYDYHAQHDPEHAFPCCDYNTMSEAERSRLLEETKAVSTRVRCAAFCYVD